MILTIILTIEKNTRAITKNIECFQKIQFYSCWFEFWKMLRPLFLIFKGLNTKIKDLVNRFRAILISLFHICYFFVFILLDVTIQEQKHYRGWCCINEVKSVKNDLERRCNTKKEFFCLNVLDLLKIKIPWPSQGNWANVFIIVLNTFFMRPTNPTNQFSKSNVYVVYLNKYSEFLLLNLLLLILWL